MTKYWICIIFKKKALRFNNCYNNEIHVLKSTHNFHQVIHNALKKVYSLIKHSSWNYNIIISDFTFRHHRHIKIVTLSSIGCLTVIVRSAMNAEISSMHFDVAITAVFVARSSVAAAVTRKYQEGLWDTQVSFLSLGVRTKLMKIFLIHVFVLTHAFFMW